MAKAILIMDMPENCGHCMFCVYCAKGAKPLHAYGKPDWCPLIKLPDRNPDREVLFSGKSFTMEDINDAFKLGEDVGWNAFIDYLEEKENGTE